MKIFRQFGLLLCLLLPVLSHAQPLTIERFIEIEHAAIALNVQRMQINLNARQSGQPENNQLQSVESLYQSYGVNVSDILRFKRYHQGEIDTWYEQHLDDAEELNNLLSVMNALSVELEALASGVQP